jgi:hypothetical protein
MAVLLLMLRKHFMYVAGQELAILSLAPQPGSITSTTPSTYVGAVTETSLVPGMEEWPIPPDPNQTKKY